MALPSPLEAARVPSMSTQGPAPLPLLPPHLTPAAAALQVPRPSSQQQQVAPVPTASPASQSQPPQPAEVRNVEISQQQWIKAKHPKKDFAIDKATSHRMGFSPYPLKAWYKREPRMFEKYVEPIPTEPIPTAVNKVSTGVVVLSNKLPFLK